MFFFQHFGLNAENDFKYYLNINVSYPRHFHRAFECLHVFYGRLHVEVDEQQWDLSAGESVLIFPNQMHAFKTNDQALFMIVIFSPDYAPEFAQRHERELPDNNLMRHADVQFHTPITTRLGQKAWIYQLIAQFDVRHTYLQKYAGSQALLYRVLDYIESNYTADCSLKMAASALGYEYSYLSHSFRKHFGMTYTHYLQQFRLLHAMDTLKTSTVPIYLIAEQNGFQSLHHFNQVFRREFHTTPSAMRRELRQPQTQSDDGQVSSQNP